MPKRIWAPLGGQSNIPTEGNLGDSYASRMLLYGWGDGKGRDIPFILDSPVTGYGWMSSGASAYAQGASLYTRRENHMSFTAKSGERWAATRNTLQAAGGIVSIASPITANVLVAATPMLINGFDILYAGMSVTFTAGGMPTGIDVDCTYYIGNVAVNGVDPNYTDFKLYASYKEAMDGTTGFIVCSTGSMSAVVMEIHHSVEIEIAPLDGQNYGKSIYVYPLAVLGTGKTGVDSEIYMVRNVAGIIGQEVVSPAYYDVATPYVALTSYKDVTCDSISELQYNADTGKLQCMVKMSLTAENATPTSEDYIVWCLLSIDLPESTATTHCDMTYSLYGMQERRITAGGADNADDHDVNVFKIWKSRAVWNGAGGKYYVSKMAPIDGAGSGLFYNESAIGANSTGYGALTTGNHEIISGTAFSAPIPMVEKLTAFGDDSEITAMATTDDRVYMFKDYSLVYLSGSSSDINRSDSFTMNKVSERRGCRARHHVIEVDGTVYFISNGGIFRVGRDGVASEMDVAYNYPEYDWNLADPIASSLTLFDQDSLLFTLSATVTSDNDVERAWVIGTARKSITEYPTPAALIPSVSKMIPAYHFAIDGKLYMDYSFTSGATFFRYTHLALDSTGQVMGQRIVSPMYGAKTAHKLNRLVLTYSHYNDTDVPITGANLDGYYIDIMPEEDAGAPPFYTALESYHLADCATDGKTIAISPGNTYGNYRIALRHTGQANSDSKPIRFVAMELNYDRVPIPAHNSAVRSRTEAVAFSDTATHTAANTFYTLTAATGYYRFTASMRATSLPATHGVAVSLQLSTVAEMGATYILYLFGSAGTDLVYVQVYNVTTTTYVGRYITTRLDKWNKIEFERGIVKVNGEKIAVLPIPVSDYLRYAEAGSGGEGECRYVYGYDS